MVQALLGHANVTTTMRYAHVSPSALRPAIEVLNPTRVVSSDFGHSVGIGWVESEWGHIAQKTGTPEITA
jgi:hypothetical protein